MAATMTWTVTPESRRAITETVAGFRDRFGPALRAASSAEAVAIAETLKDNIKIAFRAGTDKEGKSHDKGGPTYKYFHVEPQPLGAFVVGDYAALLVQEGSRAHPIDAKGDGWLMFEPAGGGFVKTKHVEHPGYAGDDYVGRAIAATDLGPFVARIVSAAYVKTFLARGGMP